MIFYFLPWLVHIRDKRLPAESVCVILPSAESLGRKHIHIVSVTGKKQEMADSLNGSQIWRTVSVGSENWQTSLYPVIMVKHDSHHMKRIDSPLKFHHCMHWKGQGHQFCRYHKTTFCKNWQHFWFSSLAVYLGLHMLQVFETQYMRTTAQVHLPQDKVMVTCICENNTLSGLTNDLTCWPTWIKFCSVLFYSACRWAQHVGWGHL